MSIQQTVVVTVAEATITDDYRVAVKIEPGSTLSPDEAAKLADEIYEAATEAATKWRADQPRVSHGFDVDMPKILDRVEEYDSDVRSGESEG